MEKIEAGVNYTFFTQLTLNEVGIPGQNVLLNIQRSSDNTWWDGYGWSIETNLVCTEDLIYTGKYTYILTGSQIQDGVTYTQQFKILSGIYTFNKVSTLYAEYDIDKLALNYDFTTYSKAVILWYDIDRPFSTAMPIYWTYVYTPGGSNPTDTAQIASKDRIIRWSEAQPV